MRIPLVGPKYQSRMLEEDMNFFWTGDQRGGGVVEAVYGTPGLREFASASVNAEARCAKVVKGVLYCVFGDTFYRVTTLGAMTSLGSLLTSSGNCWIDDNGTEIIVVDGSYGYIFNRSTSAWAQITDSDFVYPGSIAFLDGYFIGHDPDTQQFGISGSYTGTSWDALDFASAEGRPDNIISTLCDHRELWLFGTETTEVYYNSGNATFPIERISGGFMERGLAAAKSPTNIDNTVFWLSSNPKTGERMVVKSVNYTPQIATDDFMAYQLDHMDTVSDAISWGYVEGGNTFYVLTFPTENKTFALNIKTGLWHPWRSFPSNGRHRANWYVNFAGKHLVGDFENGKIYEMSMDIYNEDGNEIQRAWTLGEVASEDRNWLFHRELVVKLETGLEADTTETEPMMMLDYTDNGGKTWSSERQVSAGAVGNYQGDLRAKQLGRSRGRNYRLKTSADRKWGILGVSLRADPGRF